MGKVDDPARLERLLARVGTDDALWLSRQLEEPWRAARRRLEARAEALRASRPVIAPGLRPRPAAEVIAVELGRYISSSWREQRHLTELPMEAFERHRVLHRVAVLTGGEGLAWRTIFGALSGVFRQEG